METLYFSFFFIFFLILWIYLLKYSGVKILTISIPGFLIISIFIYQYLGFPILYFFLNDYRAEFIQDKSIIINIFFITSYTITLIILGFIFARKIFGPLHLNNKYYYLQNAVVNDRQLSRFIFYFLFVLSLLILLIYVFKIGLNNIALLKLLNLVENNTPINELRSNMGNAFEGKYHWYRLFMRDFLSIASIAFFGFYLLRKKMFYLLIFVTSFFVSCFSMTIATEKAYVLWYLISLFLMYVLIKENGRFKIKQVIATGFFGFILLGILYVYFMGSLDIWNGMKSVFSRVLLGQIQGLYFYFEIFPKQIDFIWGRSFPNPGGLFPYEPYQLTKEVYNIVFPQFSEKGIIGSMPTFFWGEMYVNFGYVGIIFPPLLIGFFLYGLNIFLYKLPMTPIFLSIYIWIIIHYKTLAGSGLSGFIIDVEMYIILFVLIVTVSASNNFKLKYYKSTKLKKN